MMEQKPNNLNQEQNTQTLEPNPQMSVYISDLDQMKTYPASMSNDEIDFDVYTSVRGNKPEDYYVNAMPANSLQKAFRYLQTHEDTAIEFAAKALMPLAEQVSKVPALQGSKKAIELESEYVSPAMKLLASDPMYGLGFTEETTPEVVANTYKSWNELWLQSPIGGALGRFGKKSTTDVPLGSGAKVMASAPWFVTEFIPSTLLEFGTRPSSWVGEYGLEKFGPPTINAMLKGMKADKRFGLMNEAIKIEEKLTAEFQTLGIPPNSKVSSIKKAYDQAVKVTHPDIVGGDGAEFVRVTQAYKKIMGKRGAWYEQIFDMFRKSTSRVRGLITSEVGAVYVPNKGEMVKAGDKIGRLVGFSGEAAIVNVGGKLIESPKDALKPFQSTKPSTDYKETLQKYYTPDESLTPEEQKIQQEAYKYLETNEQRALDDYRARLINEFGTDKVISGDESKFIIPDVTPERIRMVHEPASAYAKVYRDALMKVSKGDYMVVMGGGSGAGKTSAIKGLVKGGEIDDAKAIIDTNTNNVKAGVKNIELAKKETGEALFIYIEAEPKASWERVISRGIKSGRPVPADIHVKNQGARETVIKLMEKYKDDPNVEFRLFDNSGPKGTIKEVGIEDIKKMGYTSKGELEKLRGELDEITEQQIKSGQITREQGIPYKSIQLKSKSIPTSKVLDQELPEGYQEGSVINADRLKISPTGKKNVEEASKAIAGELNKFRDKPLSNDEVLDAAKEAEVFKQGVSRDQTKDLLASLTATRKNVAALAQENELTQEFLDQLKVLSEHATDAGRTLQAFNIEAVPEYASAKFKIISDIQKLGVSSDKILEAAKGIDFTDEQQVAKFYREFVKPTIPEILNEFVYINILSSPLTHVVNSFSNFLQLAGLNPATKLATGMVDAFASSLTGKARTHYLKEIPAYYKGVANAVPDAINNAARALQGKKYLERPDVKGLPTLSKAVDWGTLKIGKYIPRALEAGDVFFRTMIEAGEIESLASRYPETPTPAQMVKIKKQAKERAEYYVFRKRPDATNESGQGTLLSTIDQMTNAVYQLREVRTMRWFIRFVQTPANILKQGIEYSPMGVLTLYKAKDKAEQAGKAIVGSLVFAGAAYLAAQGRTTWAAPRGKKEKEAFYDAGFQPYSVKIGDKWVSYSKLGPLSYPMAMASALHYHMEESPDALADSDMEKITDAMSGIFRFFSDQSYMQGIGDIVKFFEGEKSRSFSSIPTQLIPLASLQGWVNNIIDPIMRKASDGLSIESVVDQIQMKIVGMSQFVPERLSWNRKPIEKESRIINAVSPLRVSQENKAKERVYKKQVKIKQKEKKFEKELER